jgi:FtsP/CotA-like multicopper oxidase with cupredoxin domain
MKQNQLSTLVKLTAIIIIIIPSFQGSIASHNSGSTSGGTTGGGGGATTIPVLDATNVTLVVRKINRTMNDGAKIPFWVFCSSSMGGSSMDGDAGGCSLPSPVLEINAGQSANVTLNMMMAPQESRPYDGHTIHHHGLDVSPEEDGVPETGASLTGDTYDFSVTKEYIGGHAYHCHQHTVKHLEMGMYGAFVVKSGNQINDGGPSYDNEWNMLLSTVDPAYHSDSATGDSTVFADYNPKYFLINGKQGLSTGSPADTLSASPGDKVAIRVMGLHSVNSTFRIKDGNGSTQSFTVHNHDGAKLASPRSTSSMDIAPGETRDIMVSLPSSSGNWYPQVSYKDTRDNKTYSNGTVYTQLSF